MFEEKQNQIITTTFPVATYQSKNLAWTFAFIFAAIAFPALLAHTPANQWITGTIVNALLFLAVRRVGIVNAATVAFLPSSVALLRGLLPAPTAVLIPYIILSNFILIAVFFALKKHPLSGILAASAAKFAFLFAVSFLLAKTAGPSLAMLQWPQLMTALAGGLVAVGIIHLQKTKNSET